MSVTSKSTEKRKRTEKEKDETEKDETEVEEEEADANACIEGTAHPTGRPSTSMHSSHFDNEGHPRVGVRVRRQFVEELGKPWYMGTVRAYDRALCETLILFDDGDQE